MKLICILLALIPYLFTENRVAAVSPVLIGRQSEARAVLARMAEAYKSLHSYRDTGTVTIHFPKRARRDEAHTSVKPFATSFVRPSKFRFEYRETGDFPAMNDHYVIWSNGGTVRKWWTIKPTVEVAESLNMALAGATGVSGTSAHTVPRLLMPTQIEGWSLTELQDARLLTDEKVAGEPCARVSGTDRLGDPMTLWISKRTYLILKIAEHGQELHTDKVTTYKPEANPAIKDTVFGFKPPHN